MCLALIDLLQNQVKCEPNLRFLPDIHAVFLSHSAGRTNCKRFPQIFFAKTLDMGTFREVTSHQSKQVSAQRSPLESSAGFNTQNTCDVRL